MLKYILFFGFSFFYALGCYCLYGQDLKHPFFGSGFDSTEDYSLTRSKWDEYYLVELGGGYSEEDLDVYDSNGSTTIFLVKERDTLLGAFDIYDGDAPYSHTQLWLNDKSGIKGIKNVFLALHYFSFCDLLISSYYILETSDGRFLQLPSLESVNDGNQFHYWQYRFPNEKFGQRNRIVKGYLDLTQADELISFQKEKVFLWDGEKLIPDP